MPDLKTPEALEKRWQSLEQEEDEDGQEGSMKSFFEDLDSMVSRLIDLQKSGKCPPRDREAAIMLLLKVGLKDELITPQQKALTDTWKSSLEGSRVRACRQEMTGDSDDEIVFTKRRRRSSANKDTEAHSDVCMVSLSSSFPVCEPFKKHHLIPHLSVCEIIGMLPRWQSDGL